MFFKQSAILALVVAATLTTILAASQAGDPIPSDKAHLVVKLPAEAKLLIGSSETKQTGKERHFLSPPLEPGKKYTYELTVTWTENGKPQKQSRIATVRAGERTLVDFLELERLPDPKPEKTDTDKKKPEKKLPEKKDEVLGAGEAVVGVSAAFY